MTSGLYQEFLSIQNELVHLNPAALLCYSCSCAERLVPVVEQFGEKYLANTMRDVLDKYWQLPIHFDVPMQEHEQSKLFEQLYDEALGAAYQKAQDYTLLLIADAIGAIYYVIQYSNSLDRTIASATSEFVFGAVDRFVSGLLDPGPYAIVLQRVSEEMILTSELMQKELQKQRRDIELLKLALLDTKAMKTLRIESQEMGHHFAQQIQNYLTLQIENWKWAKSAYPIASKVEGYISSDSKGVIVYLGPKAYGFISYEECEIKPYELAMFLRRKVTATVTGYDEDNRWLLLGAFQLHEESLPLYLDAKNK